VHAQMRGQCIMGSASTAVLARLIPSTLPLAMPTLLVVNVGGMYYYYYTDCLPSRPHLLRVRPWLALILPPPQTSSCIMCCLWVCAATDSRAVLGRSGQAVQVSRDHNAGAYLERAISPPSQTYLYPPAAHHQPPPTRRWEEGGEGGRGAWVRREEGS
jgi:serine/threonine protein phosphatase PrpC